MSGLLKTRDSIEHHFPALAGFLKWIQNQGWESALSASDLPEQSRSVVCKVVEASRLSYIEKLSVAEDLIAHFQDGLEAHQSCETLIADFGDTQTAAELIRNSKLRNRSMFGKIFKYLMYAMGVSMTGYVILAFIFHAGTPTPSHDYAADSNAPIAAIPAADRAWPIYRPAWIEYKLSDNSKIRYDEFLVEDEYGNRELISPLDENWETCVAKIEELQPLFATIREGAKKRSLGLQLYPDSSRYSKEDFAALFPVKDSDMWADTRLDPESHQLMNEAMYSVLLPHIISFQRLSKLLAVDTRVAVIEHDAERATDNICTIFGLARHAAEPKFLVCTLTGFSVQYQGIDTLDEALSDDADFFSDAQLQRIKTALELNKTHMQIDLEGERLSMLDFVQRCYTDNGDGNGRITPIGFKLLAALGAMVAPESFAKQANSWSGAVEVVAYPAMLMRMPSRRQTVDQIEKLIKAAKQDLETPFWENRNSRAEASVKESTLGTDGLFVGFIFPAISNVRVAEVKSRTVREATIAAIAAHQYRLENEAWPQGWAELAGAEFIDAAPVDPFTGDAMNVKFDDENNSLTIYSIGGDGDDDGATPILGKQSSAAQYDLNDNNDGDWITWPVQQR